MPARPPTLLGMVHLLPLPGSPRARPMAEVLSRACRDAEILREAGFGGIVVENFGDAPFLPGAVEPITLAAMARALLAVRAVVGELPLVANVLRNDARGALALASALELAAIRVNVHAGARVTDQGLVQGRAWETARLRASWGPEVGIWADVRVKHSAALGAERPLTEEVAEAVERGLADAVIVTGAGTSSPVNREELAAVRAVAGVPVLVGSGADAASIASILAIADGAIVGTASKVGGVTTHPVDPARARAIVRAAQEAEGAARA